MRLSSFAARFASVIALALSVTATSAYAAGAAASAGMSETDTVALHEMLEGASGQRDTWGVLPELVILSNVMEYAADGVNAGYVATGEALTGTEIERLSRDLTGALEALTGGQLTAFARVRTVNVAPGETTKIFQRGQIIVGRFRGLRTQTGTLGWGGRMTRGGGISSAAVMLDREFDADAAQNRLLRTHELAHALGYNHVESRVSVMNPRVGSDLTEFDRQVARFAFPPPAAPPSASDF